MNPTDSAHLPAAPVPPKDAIVLPPRRIMPSAEPAAAAPPPPANGLAALDHLLRYRESFFEEIFAGKDVGARLRWFSTMSAILCAIYGASMGFQGFAQGFGVGMLQSATSAVKVPILFLLSLMISYPVLYVVSALMGVRLAFGQTLALIMMALTLNSILLASCAPIAFFFVVTGSDYSFIKLLHVAIFGFSGIWSMLALWQGLKVMYEKSDLYPKQALRVFQAWIVIFALVGTQMAWSLRPFVGSPGMGFQVFRAQEGNFYKDVCASLIDLIKNVDKNID
jgi:hypothetical protein